MYLKEENVQSQLALNVPRFKIVPILEDTLKSSLYLFNSTFLENNPF